LSQIVKQKVKQAVSFISDYEQELCAVAKAEHCHGVICGHIHQPDNKFINNIHYLNSGDWVETMSALVESTSGEWEIVYYEEWLKQHREDQQTEMSLFAGDWEDELESILNTQYEQ
jgi:UDP-2,3-diacylglucosamine pyrophosphatase LpxH